MAIQLPQSFMQTLLSGANIGSGIAAREAQSEAQRKQLALQQHQQALIDQLQPYKMQALQDAHDRAQAVDQFQQMKNNYARQLLNNRGQGAALQQAQPDTSSQMQLPDVPYSSGIAPQMPSAQPTQQASAPMDLSALHQHILNMHQQAQQAQQAQQPVQQSIAQPVQQSSYDNPRADSIFGFKTPEPTFEQKLKEQSAEKLNLLQQKAKLENQSKLQQLSSAQNIKDVAGLENELPTYLFNLTQLNKLENIAKNHPRSFGAGSGFESHLPGFLGGLSASDQTARGLFGNSMQPIIQDAVQKMRAGGRASQYAMKLINEDMKPNLKDTQATVLGKIASQRALTQHYLKEAMKDYKNKTGSDYSNDEYVIVKSPSGDDIVMSKKEYDRRAGK